MATSLEVKLRNAVLATPALTALLGLSPCRWYGPQAPQGVAQPLVEVLRVSKVPMYSTTQLMTAAKYRMQLTIWDTDLEQARAVASALEQFFTTFNAYSTSSTNLQPNQVINSRIAQSEAQTDPITYWLQMDVYIWNNELT